MTRTSEANTEDIDAILEAQHRELDHILADVEFLSERRSFLQASKRFGEFRRALEDHSEIEEKVLVPLFLSHTGGGNELVAVLRADHQRLASLLENMAGALSQWDYVRFCQLLAELVPFLKEHQEREERLLHPALDAVRSKTDWLSLCRSAQVRPFRR